MKNLKYKLLLILFGISLISSLILSFTPVQVICSISSGCEAVHYSQYNYLFGVQNSDYGVVIFTLLIFLTLFHIEHPSNNKRLLINVAVVIGSLIALYFLYIQKFILQAFCKYCLVVDFSMLVSLAIILWKWKE